MCLGSWLKTTFENPLQAAIRLLIMRLCCSIGALSFFCRTGDNATDRAGSCACLFVITHRQKKGDCVKKHGLFVAIFASLALAGWSQDNAVIVESFTDGINSDSFSTTEGKWTESTAKSAAQGLQATKSVFNDANAEAATARFAPNLSAAGKYEVFLTYSTSGNATDIKYTIGTADGVQHLIITQNGRELSAEPAANQWYSLGVYNFEAGNSGYVELSDPLTGDHPLPNEPNARIYADAVKFVPVDASTAVTALNADFPASDAAPASTSEPLPGSAAIAQAAAQTPATTPAPASDAAPGLPALPGSTPAASPGLPSLPGATPAAAPGLPSLPTEVASATPALPSLPAAAQQDPAAALPGLPSNTPAPDASALPGLPATNPTENLPALPAGQSNATADLPSIPTPAPVADNLPSLAPVTPTPQRNLPSPSDTPAPTATLPLPALPTAAPSPGTGLAVPTPFSAAAAELPAQPSASSDAEAAGYSITTYNPSGLQWMYDIGSAMAAARTQGKKVLIFFTAEHNRAAQAYETESFQDPVVRQALSKYVLVKVDFPKSTRIAYGMGVFGAGVIAVLDPSSGDVTSRVVQRPVSASELITQLSSERALRATPTPGVQNDAKTPADATSQDFTSQATPATDAAPGVAPVPGTEPAPMPGSTPAAMPDLPADASAEAPAATPPTGGAAANLPGLPPQ